MTRSMGAIIAELFIPSRQPRCSTTVLTKSRMCVAPSSSILGQECLAPQVAKLGVKRLCLTYIVYVSDDNVNKTSMFL